ncbi:Hypothetical predicted protein [Lecanosticta acicola]|uniref:NmrA-like domain-containing protein n=1 Tax=Lecanosticta acicola TaxID=111012 RepID=A0AAI8Z0P2_9PEZI|nr:Hypothetical predicted protein [Lecanosticta acicola]
MSPTTTTTKSSISNVVLLGADGKLGPSILHSLIETGFHVTILKRQSSRSPSSYPNQITVSDAFSVEELVPILADKDAVIVSIKGSETALQKRLAEACVRASAGDGRPKRFIPADFGSCDSSSPLTQALVPLYQAKTELREYLKTLSRENPTIFTWTSLVCGHFFSDRDLQFLHVYPHARRAEILDDGETKFSLSTLRQIGEATCRILQRPDSTANRVLYIQSFLVSQREVISSFERATGAQWEVQRLEGEAYVRQEKAKADQGDSEAVENLVWYLGTVDANWEESKGSDLAMGELGLSGEELDGVVRKIVSEMRVKL